MNTIVALLLMVLLSVVAAEPEPVDYDTAYPDGLCGCIPDHTFCANDMKTYTSVCQYGCKHPGVDDWYILYDGPCAVQG
ncbi:uncharacterized protein LOC133516521 isoform X2 [Cydia pomonella]|uniref:uncharacterized protein LOC133516521 isoform X2 n=1 Tax=Cydia pomonella TaxID=82600 RepID=UPI002ADD8019|nr:uncharacterized protein LOC133516521 isoform X2 [Cydia pomonella]